MWFIKYLGDVLNGNILFSSWKWRRLVSCKLSLVCRVSDSIVWSYIIHEGVWKAFTIIIISSSFSARSFSSSFSEQHCGNVSYSIWLIKEIKNFHKETFLIFSQPDNIPTVRPVRNLWQCTCNLEMMENDVKTEYNSCSQNRWNFVCVENERARFFL